MYCIIHGVPKSWTWLSDFHFTLVLLDISPGPGAPGCTHSLWILPQQSWQKFLKFFLCYIFIYLLAVPCRVWGLSSLTRDGTHAPCIGSRVLTTGLPDKSHNKYWAVAGANSHFIRQPSVVNRILPYVGAFPHLFLSPTLRSSFCCYPYVTDEETDAQRDSRFDQVHSDNKEPSKTTSVLLNPNPQLLRLQQNPFQGFHLFPA